MAPQHGAATPVGRLAARPRHGVHTWCSHGAIGSPIAASPPSWRPWRRGVHAGFVASAFLRCASCPFYIERGICPCQPSTRRKTCKFVNFGGLCFSGSVLKRVRDGRVRVQEACEHVGGVEPALLRGAQDQARTWGARPARAIPHQFCAYDGGRSACWRASSSSRVDRRGS